MDHFFALSWIWKSLHYFNYKNQKDMFYVLWANLQKKLILSLLTSLQNSARLHAEKRYEEILRNSGLSDDFLEGNIRKRNTAESLHDDYSDDEFETAIVDRWRIGFLVQCVLSKVILMTSFHV